MESGTVRFQLGSMRLRPLIGWRHLDTERLHTRSLRLRSATRTSPRLRTWSPRVRGG